MFVLVHSPLEGSGAWRLVAAELASWGFDTVIPVLPERNGVVAPYWKVQAESVAQAVPANDVRPLLVAHSGAGMLLPAIRQALGRPVAGYLFADAHAPRDGQRRIDGAPLKFRAALESGGRFPTWTVADLEEAIPDPDLRREFVSELRPQPLAFFEEPIPVFYGWPDAPCAFLRFGRNPAYDDAAAHARAEQWPYRDFEGAEHFHMLVDPLAVANALVELARGLQAVSD